MTSSRSGSGSDWWALIEDFRPYSMINDTTTLENRTEYINDDLILLEDLYNIQMYKFNSPPLFQKLPLFINHKSKWLPFPSYASPTPISNPSHLSPIRLPSLLVQPKALVSAPSSNMPPSPVPPKSTSSAAASLSACASLMI